MNKKNGFTLVEIIVILAVISILAAILTPTVLKYISDAQQSRAEEDVKVVSAVINDLIKDTGKYPGSMIGAATFLCGSGTLPTTGTLVANGNCSTLSNHLLTNNPNGDATSDSTGDYPTSGKQRWKGPYVQALNADPWGNPYLVTASTLVGGNTSPTWVISAGPNGTFNTAATATSLSSDDVGVRIK